MGDITVSNRRGVATCLVVFLLVTLCSMPAADARLVSRHSIYPSEATVPLASGVFGDAACPTQDCVTIRQLLTVTNVIEDSLDTPMRISAIGRGVAEVKQRTSGPAVRRQLQRTLFAHPGRFPAQCARIRRFAAEYGGAGQSHADWEFMRDLLNVAELIESRAHDRCMSDMLAALPPLSQDTIDSELLLQAYDLCSAGQWSNPGCERLRLPPRQ